MNAAPRPTTLCPAPRGGARLRSALAFGLAALALCGAPRPAAAFDEPTLKAAIVYRLLAFVEWPPQRLPQPGGLLVLCVERGSALVAPLRLLAQGRPGQPASEPRSAAAGQVRQWQLDVREAPPTGLPACHAWAGAQPPAGLRGAAATLVVSDGADEELVHIRLVRDGDRMGFELELGNARRNGLQISSRLARLARAVHE